MSVSNSVSNVPRPTALQKVGDDRLRITWSDGQRRVYTWRDLRDACPCAGCREERGAPPDPLRVLKPSELLPLKPTALEPVGYYAYRITWSDGHDAGLYTLEHLRQLGIKEEGGRMKDE